MASLFGNTIIQTAEEKSSLDAKIEKIINRSYNIELNAFYRAFVCNNNDPLKLGRVQIRIPSIHGTNNTTIQTPTDSLPWASPGIWNCAGNDMGQYLVPEVGTLVFVTFEQGDATKPIYFGGISNQIGDSTKYIVNPNDINRGEAYKVNTNDFPEDLTSVHDKMLFKSAKGNEVVSSDLDGKEYMYLVDASGQSIEMENFGPYLKRRGTDLGYSGNPRMKLSTNRGSDMVLTNESEIMTTRNLMGQLDDIKILNKTDDLSGVNGQLDKLLRDNFKDFGNYSYNKDDKVFNLDVKLNDILDLTTTTDKVYDYPIKIFEEFEYSRGFFLQINLVSRDNTSTRALINYRNTNYSTVKLDREFTVYFADLNRVEPFNIKIDKDFNLNIPPNSEGNFYATIESIEVYNFEETWGFDYRKEFRFIVDTTQIPDSDIFTLNLTSGFTGYISKIDWGDGSTDIFDSAQMTYEHDYQEAGSYYMTWYTDDINFTLPTLFTSRGIVSIESPIPYADNTNGIRIKNFGAYIEGYTDRSTLVHINKYLLRNYLLNSKTINLSSCFYGCNNLKEIPYSLLRGFEKVSGLYRTFSYCESLRAIPEDLFEGIDMSLITSLAHLFNHCYSLETLPEFLFADTSFENVEEAGFMLSDTGILKVPSTLLYSMTNLKYINYMFYNSVRLAYIPKDFFIRNRKLITAGYIFKGCVGLTSIPRNLFIYNTNLTSLQNCFEDCTNIEEIDSDMFRGLSNIQDLSEAFKNSGLTKINLVKTGLITGLGRTGSLNLSKLFYGCTKLNIKETDLLNYDIDKILPSSINLNNFMYRETFEGTGSSTLPPLWSITNINSYTGAFGGAGNNSISITNYSSIPGGWK